MKNKLKKGKKRHGILLAVFFGINYFLYSRELKKFLVWFFLNLFLFWTIIIPIVSWVVAIVEATNNKELEG